MPDSPHILVIRRRYLGDIVLLGSLFRNLKLHWPRGRIAVLCEPAYADVLTMNPDVAEVFPFPASAGRWPGLVGRLRRARFSHVLDLDNRDKTAFLTRVTGAPVRLALRHGEKLHLPSLYTGSEVLPVEYLAERHITDLYLHLLGKLGVPVATRELRLIPRAEDLAYARQLLASFHALAPGPSLLVHPGSRSQWRVWPAAQYAIVIDRLRQEGKARVALIAGPGEQVTVQEITRHLRTPVTHLDGKYTIPQLAAIFASFDALLCHDSGPMHLAAAVGTQVIALFGSQPLNIWQPVGEGHVTLQPPLPCAHCVTPGRCQPHDSYNNHCVRNITADRVYEAVAGVLR